MTALIPRELIFGNPVKILPRVSPDGTMLSYLAPHEGKLSVWVVTIGADDARVVAHDPVRPIPWADWHGDGRHVLYVQDRAGDENYHLFCVSLASGEPRDLTPGENVRAIPLTIDRRFPTQMLITSNARDPKVFDVCRIDFARGTMSIDTQNPGTFTSWLCDGSLTVRAAIAREAEGACTLRVREGAADAWRIIETFSFLEGVPKLVAFSPDGGALTIITAKGADRERLVRYDLASGAPADVVSDDAYDVGDPFVAPYIDPPSAQVYAVPIVRERLTWHAVEPAFAADLQAIAAIRPGDFSIDSASADGNVLVIHSRMDDQPNAFYAYDRRTKNATFLFHARPDLLEFSLAPMKPIALTARDGLALHGYLTLPPGVPPTNLPTVLYVHGGPWIRDKWGYEPNVQWFANRGYAVVQVNFRASTGYGKAFRNAGNREWAGTMRTDLLDARDWAIAQGIADPARFAIFGGSYGGYAVLTALAFTPDAFTCGVCICGISNLNTFLSSIPPYWGHMLGRLHESVGEDPAFLDAQSPLSRARDIRAPLLIGHGANDKRATLAESTSIVSAMRANGIPVTYVVFENEGHGFADPANNKRFTALAERFLGEHLGGRIEPAHPDEDIDAFLR